MTEPAPDQEDQDAVKEPAVVEEWTTRPRRKHSLIDMMVWAQQTGIRQLSRRDAHLIGGSHEVAESADADADVAFAAAKVFELASFDEKGFRAFCVRAKSGKRSAS